MLVGLGIGRCIGQPTVSVDLYLLFVGYGSDCAETADTA